jgi:ABC-type phosphate/phosphonate transport system substrate-binding protein
MPEGESGIHPVCRCVRPLDPFRSEDRVAFHLGGPGLRRIQPAVSLPASGSERKGAKVEDFFDGQEAFLRAGGALAAFGLPTGSQAAETFSLGLTPVLLDNDAIVIERLRSALSEAMGEPVDLVQRRTYQEITATILDGSVDAAWICGYPFLRHRGSLSLLGVPVWRGRPLYQSYLIVRDDDAADALSDLRGVVHAFSNPDSNSGYLATASDLARLGDAARQSGCDDVLPHGLMLLGTQMIASTGCSVVHSEVWKFG